MWRFVCVHTVSACCTSTLCLHAVPAHCVYMLYQHTVSACCTAYCVWMVVPAHCVWMLYQHTVSACCTSTLCLHAVPAHCVWMLYQHTVSACCTSTLCLHAVPAYCVCMLYLTSTLCLNAVPAHCVCMLYQHTVSVCYTRTLCLYAVPAHCVCMLYQHTVSECCTSTLSLHTVSAPLFHGCRLNLLPLLIIKPKLTDRLQVQPDDIIIRQQETQFAMKRTANRFWTFAGYCWHGQWSTWRAVTGRELPKQIYTESLSLPHDTKFLHFAAGIVEIMWCLRLQEADKILVMRRGKAHVPRYHVSE